MSCTENDDDVDNGCLLYTSDAADEEDSVDLGGRRIIKKKKKKEKNKDEENKEAKDKQADNNIDNM